VTKKKYDSYELEIIIALGVLILFLTSINYISGYSFERARKWQSIQFEKSLDLAADYTCHLIENESDTPGLKHSLDIVDLQAISLLTGVENIAIYDSSGNVVLQAMANSAESGMNVMHLVKQSILGHDGRSIGYVELSSENTIGQELRRLSRWDLIFRIGGLLASLIVGAYFLRAILLPYRRIKNEAMNFNLDTDQEADSGGIEYVVDTFKGVIEELEEKKSRLEILYKTSEKKADSFARYNEYILESISSGVIICDSHGIVTKFNPSAQGILKHLEKDCRGKHYKDVFKTKSKLVAMLDDALVRKIVHSRQEFEMKLPDGKVLWLGCSSSLINDEKGEGMGAVLLLIDLTDIRRLQEVSSYNEKMVTLGETAAGLAHEIRNSFAAIIGFANLLRRNIPREQVVKIAETIKDESVSAEGLMSRFLSFAKPLELHLEMVNICNLINSSLEYFSHKSLDKIKITPNFDSDLPEFAADPVLLKQVFSNMLLNCCDAMPNGGEIRIHVALNDANIANSQKKMIISITDGGTGIDSEHISKIFDPFFTLKANGTGLGLALVKKIIIMHQGRIEVYSKPGKGTRFTIHLPIRTISKDKSNQECKFAVSPNRA
jgi:PAS domain S-box-containing protein